MRIGIAVFGLALVVAACGSGSDEPESMPSPASPANPTDQPSATATATPSRPYEGPPARIRIPSRGIEAQIEALGVDQNNTLQDTSDPLGSVGWYPDYGKPGTPGNSYLAGFSFFQGKPGPLRKLAELQAGDAVELLDANGGIARYVVISLKRYDNKTLPFGDILFAEGRPENAEWITIMTAGGELDAASGNFLQSDVVVAERKK